MRRGYEKILIVDDEERIRNIYTRLFAERGFIVRQASDAVTATNILIRENIGIVLLDIKMPEINGKTMFEVIEEYDPSIKIIISSVYPIDRQRKMIPKAADYFDKSQGLTILLNKIETLSAVGVKSRVG